MKYRTLGKTGLVSSVVGIGTWQLGGEWGMDFNQAAVDSIFDAGRECGINFIDTAECYGDHLSETLVGKAIKKDRGKWILATKFGHTFVAPFQREFHYDAASVKEQLEASLKALDTDYVDVYQFHSGANNFFDNDELWEYLRLEKEKGRIRFVGISLSPNDNMYQAERATQVGADTIQIVYNRIDRKPEEAVFPSCQRQHLGTIVRVPLASGFLSGKYKPGHVWSSSDVRSRLGGEKQSEQLIEVEKIIKTEVPQGIPMVQWALAWCLQHPAVTLSIPGCKSADQVRKNASAADLDMVSPSHPLAARAPEILP